MRLRWGIAAGLVLALMPRVAAAQATDRVLAEALFREGRELMDKNKVPEACAKFAESYRLDHALGTLVNLALCHEKDGKTATAWAEFNDAASEAALEKDDREAFARRHVTSLEAELPRMRLVVESSTAALATVEIKLDDAAIGKTAWSTALPIDPGEHRLDVASDGKKPYSTKVTIPKGAGTTDIPVPALTDAPKPIAVAPSPSPSPSSEAATSGSSPQRLLGFIVGGVGIVGLAVGGGFGIAALSSKSDRDDHCSGGFCDRQGVDADSSARHSATASTVAFIAGGVLTAGGIVLVLTAPKHRAMNVGVVGQNVVLGGSF